MNMLKANRYQLMCVQNELMGRSPPIEAYNEYITTSKDKVSELQFSEPIKFTCNKCK